MKGKHIKVLLIEDNVGDTQLIREMLTEVKGTLFDLECVDRLSTGLERLATGGIDVILLDLGLPDSQGLDTFAQTYAQVPEVPIVVLTGLADEVVGVEAVKGGAQGYLAKGQVDGNLLVRSLRYAIERQRAEESLRESEERYRSVVEHSHAGVLIVDDTYRFIYVNDELCRILGYSREEIVGQDFRRFLDDESEQLVADRYVRRQRAEKVPPRYEFNIIRKDGEKRHVEISSTVIKDSAGKVKTVAQILDITERKRAEEQRERLLTQIEQERDKLRTLIDSIADEVWFCDAKGNLSLVNVAAARGLGFEGAEEVHQPMPEWLSKLEIYTLGGRPRPQEDAPLLRSLRGEILKGVEEIVRHPQSGEMLYRQISSAPLRTEAGQIMGAVAVVRDITERKRAEEALREYSERLEEMVEERAQALREAQEELLRKEKLATLGQLAGGVAHELRNPLGSINNATYFLSMVLEETDPEVKEMLEIIDEEVGTCNSIIGSLLEFARTRPPVRQEVDVNGVVREALARTSIPESVELVSQLDDALPTILADPDQLRQAFGNIILNAVQAMPEGGQLVVKSESRGDPGGRPGWVGVSIADTGVGIPEEDLERIFEPLFTTKAKGIGLGLSLVKILVEGHGGSIEVESEPTKGTTFTIELPISGARQVFTV